jgi:CRISPR-associated protein (TIGR03984 family)
MATTSIAGCRIAPINREDCEQVVAWLLGKRGSAPEDLGAGFAWVLAHSDDGVTWGRFDGEAGRWRLGHDAVPDVSPPIRPEALQELRLFGDGGEVMIWRSDEGLRGRLLEDAKGDSPRDEADPLRPSEELRIVRGDRIRADAGGGFTRVTDATGAEQVLPIALDDAHLRQHKVRLHVRHYWAQNAEDGTVRIAVTRLLKLTTGGRDVG